MRNNRKQSFSVLLLAAILLTQLVVSRAGTALQVDESATTIRFSDQGSQAGSVVLTIVNPLGVELQARIHLDWLDTADGILATDEQIRMLPRGASRVMLPFSLGKAGLSESELRSLLWYRLRYRVEAVAPVGAVSSAEGILSVGSAAPEAFGLRLASPQAVRGGEVYRARVRAVHSVTSQPVRGVKLEAKLTVEDWEEEESELTAAATTDARGFAAFEFPLPARIASEPELEISGRLGPFTDSVSSDAYVDRPSRTLLSTDKPIYQPGQTLHARVLMMDATGKPVEGMEIPFIIQDQEDEVVFRATVTTSRFGIADTEWMIPESIRLGNYHAHLDMDDGPDRYLGSSRMVKIGRYELPNFVVTAKSDRAFYLPGENAMVEVRADYLFGKPVAQGRVRLVREKERYWDYRKQKWDTDEAEEYAGTTGNDGVFLAEIDLSADHAELAENDYTRFSDQSYAAYFTDASTNRTEQRRFSLRLTRDPIHVYVIERGRDMADGLPLRFFVSTYYADGTPASCDVTIRQSAEVRRWEEQAETYLSPILRRVRTNRYGLARVDGLRLPSRTTRSHSGLVLEAQDRKGQTGYQSHGLWMHEGPALRVATDKTLYRPGEPIQVDLLSTLGRTTVFVEVRDDVKVLAARSVRLRGERGALTIPSQASFSGELTVLAYAMGHGADRQSDYSTYDSRQVLFPKGRALKLTARWSKAEYHPGDKAAVTFQVRTPEGRAVESAIGVVVFDRAVEERARTDSEFGNGAGQRFAYAGQVEEFLGADGAMAGVSRMDLDVLDSSQPFTAEMDLLAAALLNHSRSRDWLEFDRGKLEMDPAGVFAPLLKRQLHPAVGALQTHYQKTGDYTADAALLKKVLADGGVDLRDLRDPWGSAFEPSYSYEREQHVLQFLSRGPDKKLGTDDDFAAQRLQWPYFRKQGEAIEKAVSEYRQRSGAFVRDAATLAAALKPLGHEPTRWRDPWGTPYRFEFDVDRAMYTITARSAGPDRVFAEGNSWSDITLWTVRTDYFADARLLIDAALVRIARETGRFPENEAEFRSMLLGAGVDLASVRDPWGREYYPQFSSGLRSDGRRRVVNWEDYNARAQKKSDLQPVTRKVNYAHLRSRGPDGEQGTRDDFEVAMFWRAGGEQAGEERLSPQAPIPFTGASSAITGRVTDPTEAVIPGAKITATHQITKAQFAIESNEAGRYLLRNLPPGLYRVEIYSMGFRSFVVVDVPVRSSAVTRLDATLEVGEVSETVTVESAAIMVQTESAMLSVRSSRQGTEQDRARLSIESPLFTPRLREDFPETLLWQPEVITDARGRARIEFPLAGNITTWKLSVLASTATGLVGGAETEVRAFQPFFVEHDPPKALTTGDEIALPVVLRNYHDRAQDVDVELHPAPWFELLGAARKHLTVPAGHSVSEVFPFRALLPVRQGKQRVTAAGRSTGDAVEKPVRVRPDGNEVVTTSSQVFNRTARFDLQIPPDAIAGAIQAELKLYPSLMAHVMESVEGIMKRPYGCGEQTISSTYPSLLVLRYAGERQSPLLGRARRYLREGYERLLNYREPGGGFSYWGKGAPDAALTAYALRFLHDASSLIEVDADLVTDTRAWLARQLDDNGSWRSGSSQSHLPRTLMQTAFIARVLAMTQPAAENEARQNSQADALAKAMRFLAAHVEQMEEPYVLASLALAASDAGWDELASRSVARLRGMARTEGDATYWSLETNTPFHGWGLAGRVETTALVVQALARSSSLDEDALVNRGLAFLLGAKDRYGVWHSTQATVNVLDTIMVLVNRNAKSSGGEQRVEVWINGSVVSTVTLPPDGEPSGPVTVDLVPFVTKGLSRIEVRRPVEAGAAAAQLVSSYYVPWAVSDKSTPDGEAKSDALRYRVEFDKTEAAVSEVLRCRVAVERVGFRSYGMLIAEIGLPPGVEVDRASLERAKEESGWSFSHYDVLPDRVVAYVWPRGGGIKFEFAFRPRFDMTAKAAPSLLYDYYNPDARVVVAPPRFRVGSVTTAQR